MDRATLSASAPRARVSRGAIERNLRAAVGRDLAVDLRRDACGHGAETTARAAVAAGIGRAVCDDAFADRARELGLERAAEPSVDPRVAFGLDGAGEQALTFAAPVLQTKPLRAGDGVSYGYRWRAASDTRAALVSGGYAQGVVRALGGATRVLLAGRELPIVGRVAMDVCVVDAGDAPVEPGDEAVYFGADAPHLIREWERATGMTALELVCAVGLRAERKEIA